MRFLKYLIVMILLIVLQSTLLNAVSIFGIKPDLLLIFLVFVSIRLGPIFGALCGFCVGFIQDVYAWEHLGANALSKTCAGYLVGLAEMHLLHIEFIPKVILMIIAYFLQVSLFFWACKLDTEAINQLFFSFCLPQSLYTFALGALFFHLYQFSGSHDNS